MILGNNPAGQGFGLRDLVLIELSGHAPPPPPSSLGEREVKNFRTVFAGRRVRVRNFNFGGGGRGSRNFEVKNKTA